MMAEARSVQLCRPLLASIDDGITQNFSIYVGMASTSKEVRQIISRDTIT